MHTPQPTETVADRIAGDVATARDEIKRADGKASDLAKFALAGLGVLVAVLTGRHLPAASQVLDILAMAAGLVLWPRLGRTILGYLAHRQRSTDQIVAALSAPPTDEQRADQLRYLVRLVVIKFRLVHVTEIALLVGLLLAVTGAFLR